MQTQVDELMSMNYVEASALLRETIQYNRKMVKAGAPHTKLKTLYFSSSPGTGKSALAKGIASEEKLQVIEVFLSEYDPAELGGFVYRDGSLMHKARPAWLPWEGEGILMLEEFSDASTASQNIACRLIRERSLGDHKLGDGWTIVACGNRQKDRSGAQQLVKKFNNRVAFIQLDVVPDQWVETAGRLGLHPAVIAYIGRNPQSLNKFDPLHEVSPTPRTWEFVSDTIQHMKLPDGVLRKTIAGYVGKGEANNFVGFYKRMNDLPHVDDIVRAPDTIPVPTDIDIQYATVAHVAAVATPKTVGPILQYLDRFDRRELVVFAVRYMHSREKALSSAPAFSTWLAKHAKEFLV